MDEPNIEMSLLLYVDPGIDTLLGIVKELLTVKDEMVEDPKELLTVPNCVMLASVWLKFPSVVSKNVAVPDC